MMFDHADLGLLRSIDLNAFAPSYLALLLLPLVMVLACMPRIIAVSIRNGWIDQPSARKVHKRLVPRCGGLGIFLGFFPAAALVTVLHGAWGGHTVSPLALHLLAATAAMLALGLADDIFGVRARWKLVVQMAIAAWMVAVGFRLPGLFFAWVENPMLLSCISVLWIVGVTNAVNLIDGLDGLAGGISLLVLGTLSILASGADDILAFTLPLMGAVIGFLFYNRNPARVFMGDSGSLVLGFVIAMLSLDARASGSPAGILVPLIALGVPVFDMVFAMARRFLVGHGVMDADREHLHHKLLDIGLDQRQAVRAILAMTLVLCSMALALSAASDRLARALIILYPLGMYVLVKRLGYLPRIARAWRRNAKTQRLHRYRRGYREPSLPARIWSRTRDAIPVQASLDVVALVASWGLAIRVARPIEDAAAFLAVCRESALLVGMHVLIWMGCVSFLQAYQPLWRYADLNGSTRHLKAIAISILAVWALAPAFLRIEFEPRLLGTLGGSFLVFSLAIRMSRNVYDAYMSRRAAEAKTGPRVLVFGAGDRGRSCLEHLVRSEELDFRVVGFLDDDPLKLGRSICGRIVLGSLEQIAEVHRSVRFDLVVLSTFPHRRARRQALQDACDSLGVKLVVFRTALEEARQMLDFDSQVCTTESDDAGWTEKPLRAGEASRMD